MPALNLPGGQQSLTPERLTRAYRQAGGNITQAARLLGVHKVTLYRHMKTHGITRSDLAGRSSGDAKAVAAADKGGAA